MNAAERIRTVLTETFAPTELEVVDDSARHAGHAGAARAEGGVGETHFSVRLVSETFAGVGRVERQRQVYAALDAEFRRGLHALSLKVFTPEEASRAG